MKNIFLPKIKKGESGYIEYMKKRTLIKTIILFLISLLIFAAGYLYAGKKENIITVVAILGILPASRSLVNFIMFMRFKEMSETVAKSCAQIVRGSNKNADILDCIEAFTFYDSILTMEKGGSHKAEALCCINKNLIGYVAEDKYDIPKMEKHLRDMLKKNSLSMIGVKLFNSEDKFLTRYKDLTEYVNESYLNILDNVYECDSVKEAEKKYGETGGALRGSIETIALLKAISL